MGKQWKQCQTLFFGAPKSLQMVIAAKKLKDACSLEENYDKPRQHIKKQRHYFANKGPPRQSYGFSSSHMWDILAELTASYMLQSVVRLSKVRNHYSLGKHRQESTNLSF